MIECAWKFSMILLIWQTISYRSRCWFNLLFMTMSLSFFVFNMFLLLCFYYFWIKMLCVAYEDNDRRINDSVEWRKKNYLSFNVVVRVLVVRVITYLTNTLVFTCCCLMKNSNICHERKISKLEKQKRLLGKQTR